MDVIFVYNTEEFHIKTVRDLSNTAHYSNRSHPVGGFHLYYQDQIDYSVIFSYIEIVHI